MGFSSYADVQAALDAEAAVYNPNVTQPGWESAHANANAAREWWANYQNSHSSPPSSSPPATNAPSPAPTLPIFTPMPSNTNFKVAPSDIIQFDDSNIEIELITNLLFEDVGAVELADISRSDLIDGQEVIYSPIIRLPEIRRDFDPNKIVSNVATVDYFSQFLINLLSRGMNEPYFDNDGNLIIEIDNVLDDEKIEVEILSSGTIEIIGEE
jgi:hypothetical protein